MMPNHQIVSYTGQKGLLQLLQESWAFYRQSFWRFSKIMSLPIFSILTISFSLYFLNFGKIRYSLIPSIIDAVSIPLFILLFSWSLLSLIYSIGGEQNLKLAFRKSFRHLGYFLIISLLLFLILIGGFLLAFIAFLFFSVWFSLAVFPLFLKEESLVLLGEVNTL